MPGWATHDAIFLAIVGLLTAMVVSPVYVTYMQRREKTSLEDRERTSRKEMAEMIINELRVIQSLLRRGDDENGGV